MRRQLSHIKQVPRNLPIWPTLLADLCNPSPKQIGQALGISERTVRRYNAEGQAPRAVCLALFWVTRWGRSEVLCQAQNTEATLLAYVRSLEDHMEDLERLIEHMRRIGHFGAANDPDQIPVRPVNLPTLPR